MPNLQLFIEDHNLTRYQTNLIGGNKYKFILKDIDVQFADAASHHIYIKSDVLYNSYGNDRKMYLPTIVGGRGYYRCEREFITDLSPNNYIDIEVFNSDDTVPATLGYILLNFDVVKLE